MADGPAGLLGRLAGQGHDLDDLLGAEGSRPPRAGRVVEDLFDQREQRPVVGTVGLDLPQAAGRAAPAVAPEADGDAGEAKALGDRFQARIVGESAKDADAPGQAHGSGLAVLDLPQQRALPGGKLESARMGAAHGLPQGNDHWAIFCQAVLLTQALIG